jgi:hypothetical protein
MQLTPCPCGRPARWYRVVLVPRKAADGSVEVLRVDDSFDDLCERCFRRDVPADEREGWERVTIPAGELDAFVGIGITVAAA